MNAKKKLDIEQATRELEESVYFQPISPQTDKPVSTQVDKTISPQTDKPVSTQVDKTTKPQTEKYTTHLTPATIKAVKWYALEHDLKDYEVVQQALDVFLAAKHE